MPSPHLIAVAAGLSLFLAGSQPLLADSTVFDGTFNNADWTSAVVADTTTNKVGSFTASQQTSGGNPDSYRRGVLTYDGSGYVYASNLYNAVTYNPTASGAIASLGFSYNFLVANPPFSGAAVGYIPFVLQSGVIYQASRTSTTATSWRAYSVTGLTAANFSNLTSTGGQGTLRPDFSATGSPLQFGYLNYDTGQGPITSGTDNFQVNIVNVVPEPSTWALLGVGAVGLSFAARRRAPVRA